ncbi:DUF4352 domain-containing protein [Fredinandcohnia quinoae]|uniref:DUF4352 domain-containing protein n=1 Tax=Fredinandcohnia quinoae TaxID=2918902 RepID=A0AAW5E782_9BACI|nr:DUF4352 domain-containing protein [Fredinandcohnia sp. SECRCQ15]MCH1625762.1 DUF4352 domain-containing protein [Fredinandcohnia sp. SECRCQ15]
MANDKIKKPFYKRWWFWLIVIIIIIALATGGGDDEKVEQKNDDVVTDNNNNNDNDKTKEEPKEEEKKAFGIGEEVKVGDMVYTINKKTTADQVGPSALPEKATGKFIVLDVTLKNNGNEAVTVDSSFFKLLRGEKTYESDSMASMSANQGENGTIENSFLLQELNPDSVLSGRVVFDVAPEVADATDLQVQVQTGLFGTETEVINLQ